MTRFLFCALLLMVGGVSIPLAIEARDDPDPSIGAGTPVSLEPSDQIVPLPCTPGVNGCPETGSEASRYGTCEFVMLINNVIEFVIWFASILATLVIMYAGFRLVTSGGDVSAKTKAKDTLVSVIIGYGIVLAAFLIINTILSLLVPGDSKILNWQSIECIYPTVTKQSDVAGLAEKDTVSYWDDEFDRPIGVTTGGLTIGTSGGSSGGSCNVATAGWCGVSNLGCFGSSASAASQVCNIESGGNPSAVSGTDLCEDRRSFSGGLFQINILANNRYLNNCAPDFFVKHGSSAQGDCVQWVENSGGVRYCQIRNCRITNVPKYNNCMNQTFDPRNNISIACQLFDASGKDFDPWITSAQRCGVQ